MENNIIFIQLKTVNFYKNKIKIIKKKKKNAYEIKKCIYYITIYCLPIIAVVIGVFI